MGVIRGNTCTDGFYSAFVYVCGMGRGEGGVRLVREKGKKENLH